MQDALAMDNEISGQEQENDVVAKLKQEIYDAKKKAGQKQTTAEEGKQALNSVTSQPSATALKWAWGVLIPSFGLSLIWINVHCFFYIVFGEKIVCKLGDEWKVPGAASLNKQGSLANTIEPMVVAFLDFVFFISGITMVTLIVIMADFYTNPLSYLRVIFEAVYNYFFPIK